MKLLKVLIGAILTGAFVAITYWLFEAAVRNSIEFFWDNLLDTDERRFVMVIVCVVVGMIYFGLQHILDQKAEGVETKGLGGNLSPSIKNYLTVLVLGFYSLLAGASLGPEAILVPACVIVGSYIGSKITKDDQIIKLLGAAGLVALFVAFFNSLIFALLGLYLLKQETKITLKPVLIITALVASLSTYFTLRVFEAPNYFNIPAHNSGFSLNMIAVLIGLFLAGFIYTKVLGIFIEAVEVIRSKTKGQQWWKHAFIASFVLALIFLAGGPLIQFTGNESIQPLLNDASTLGFLGLLWIVITKTLAIAWSKVMGYRGGMIFPSIFVAAALVAMGQFLVSDLSIPLGMIVVLAGTFFANSRKNVLL